ncbi:hypothetical protein Pelo_8412 [Pelomyxa schiedti]|nr:hypothetical protein Pelo_8412 [Pelomyxa schiedti]
MAASSVSTSSTTTTSTTDHGAAVATTTDDENILMQGYLSMKVSKGKRFRPFFAVVYGGTMFYYKNELDVVPAGSANLGGCEVALSPDEPKQKNLFKITSPTATLFASASKPEKRDAWIEAVRQGITLPAHAAPPKDYVPAEKKSIGFRAKKTLGSKIVGSRLGKQSLESFVLNDHVRSLIRALRKIVEAESSKESADFIEKSIIKLVMKVYFEWSRKTISTEDLMQIDRPLREAFNLIDKMYRTSSRKKAALMKENFLRIELCFGEVFRMLGDLMRPHLRPVILLQTRELIPVFRPVNMMMMQQVVDIIGSASFLMRVWDLNREDTTGHFDENMFALVNAMTSYTQIEFHP